MQIFLGQGNGTFTAGELVDESGGPFRDVVNAVLADVNGDGCPDVVDVDTIALIHIFPGDCKGDFDNTTNYPSLRSRGYRFRVGGCGPQWRRISGYHRRRHPGRTWGRLWHRNR